MAKREVGVEVKLTAGFAIWFKILVMLIGFTGLCYVIAGISEGIILNPEIMGNTNVTLNLLIAGVFATVFKAFFYMTGIAAVLWFCLGILSLFL